MPTISTLVVDVETRTRRFTAGLKTLVGGLAVVGAAAGYAFKQFEDSEKILNQTDAVLKSTGHAANVTATEVNDLANAISAKTGIDDEAIQSGENLILTFKNIANEAGKGNDIFNQTTQVVTDMSVAMGQDFKSSAIQVGKALNDPITGLTSLTRVGVQFTEQQKDSIAQFVKHNNLLGAQKIILQELTSEFGGSAVAQKTASETMTTALGNLAETVGGLLAPAVTALAEGLGSVASFIEEHAAPAWEAFKEGVLKAWDAVKPFASAIGDVLIPLFQTAWHTIQDRILPALNRIKPVLILIGAAVVLFATMILAQFALVVTAVGFVIDKFLDFVGFIRDKVVEPVVNFLGRIVSFVMDKVRPIWDVVRDAAATAWHAVAGFIEVVIGKIETLIGWIRSAIQWLGQLGKGVGEALAGKAIDAGIISPPPGGFQHGGMVARTGLAMVHKGEVFSGVNNEMGFGGNVLVEVYLDGEKTSGALDRILTKRLERSGAIFNGAVRT